MAAYNAGAGKMRKTLRRIDDPVNDRDFWYIYRMGYMSAETREYVPKIMAMILIDRNRTKYGFPAERKAGVLPVGLKPAGIPVGTKIAGPAKTTPKAAAFPPKATVQAH
jgi:membrane-bound lytic murein transglycosylase D